MTRSCSSSSAYRDIPWMRISQWRAPGTKEPKSWARQTHCGVSSRWRAAIAELPGGRPNGTPRDQEGMTMARYSWRLFAAGLALLGFVTVAWAETEVDPGAVSEGLKAIFKYGGGTHETA